jgi:hypothetical protein
VLEDHEGYARWADVREAVLSHPGDPPPNGLGAVRVIRASGIAIREEVVAFEPPSRLGYVMTAGLPVRDYRGDVLLEPSDGGTEIRWKVTFRPLIPGTGPLLRWAVQRTISGLVAALTRAVAG